MTIEAVARLALPEQASVSRFHPLTQKRMLWLRKRRRQRRRPRRPRRRHTRRSSLEGSGGASRSAWAGWLSKKAGLEVRLFDSRTIPQSAVIPGCALLRAGPESITTVPATLALNATSVVMDFGFARRRAPRNDGVTAPP